MIPVPTAAGRGLSVVAGLSRLMFCREGDARGFSGNAPDRRSGAESNVGRMYCMIKRFLRGNVAKRLRTIERIPQVVNTCWIEAML